jgi:hypothetical protein
MLFVAEILKDTLQHIEFIGNELIVLRVLKKGLTPFAPSKVFES